jgi:glutamyl-Q tRNA(Asp) synthetase
MLAGACGYVGRFAPSPTGPLHAGSLVAALASWLDARANQGRWLVRIEDIDTPRCVPGAGNTIISQLAALGLLSDAPVVSQSTRSDLYQCALDQLLSAGLVYPCACSRTDIETALAAIGQAPARHQAAVYPGTCRHGLHGRTPRAWRIDVGKVMALHGLGEPLAWHDRRLGAQFQNVSLEVGDFVLRRADGL